MSEVMTREEYQAAVAKPKRGNKFGAKRTLIDGICFDSKREASYYAALKLRERAGEVTDVELQHPYALTVNGVLVATYRADFVFWDISLRRRRVIDVKGVMTPVFRLKQKLMRACHKIEIEVVK
jgi:hypothetical protein